jgi:hypothetical protein
VLSYVGQLVHETVALSLSRQRSRVPRRFHAGNTPASHAVRQHSEVWVAALRLRLSRLPSVRFLHKSPLDLAQSRSGRPRRFPLQRRQFHPRCSLEVFLGVRRCSFLTLFNIIHRLRRRDPCLGNDIVNRRLHALCVVLCKQTQVFVSDLDVGPYALIQHKKLEYRGATSGHK